MQKMSLVDETDFVELLACVNVYATYVWNKERMFATGRASVCKAKVDQVD